MFASVSQAAFLFQFRYYANQIFGRRPISQAGQLVHIQTAKRPALGIADMDMSRRMITDPPSDDVAAAPDATHRPECYIGSPETFVKARYASTSFFVSGPGFPLPMTRPSILTTGMISAPVPVTKHSSALNKS